MGCKPENRTKDLVCEMSVEQLKPILNDMFIYAAARSTKSLDSLTQSYPKESVLRAIYKKHNTNRAEIKKAIKCFTEKETLIPLIESLEKSYENWKEIPEFNTNGSTDSIQ